MWYQSVWITQILIILAFVSVFFALVRLADKRWLTFSSITIFLIFLSIFSLFFETKYRQKIERFQVIEYDFEQVKDLSDFEADKYAVTVVTDPDLSKTQTKAVIDKATEQVRKERKDANVIWVAVFDNSNADFQKLNDNNPSFIAQSQWKSKTYQGLLPESFVSNDTFKDIKIYFNNRDT